MTILRNIWSDERGQNWTEQTLLIAFVVLIAASLFISAGGTAQGIWSTTNNQFAAAMVQL